MKTAPTIPMAPPSGSGLDYTELLAEAIALTQALSGDIWTDYNEHDPGVTIVEQLCYAITELSYRAGFPVADLLVGPKGGAVDLTGQSLYQARAILPNAPVTPDDFRRRILDLLPELGNVWLSPLAPSSTHGINGLYDIAIYAPGADPCCCTGRRPEQLREIVRRIFCRYRALCEDVESIRVLEPLNATVEAVVSLDGDRDSAVILAEILFSVGVLFAPEPKRQPLSALIEAGATPAEIFDGPLLRNGFIADDQLTDRATGIALTDVVRAMAGIDGVVAVSALAVLVGPTHTIYDGAATIPIPDWAILHLGNATGDNPIRLFRGGVQCHPDPARVRRELAKLWTAQRRTYRLATEYRRYFPVPSGQWTDPNRYYSIQNQFPNLYGISAYGLPANASPMRQGQAKQLKGYLLAFEQLLADYFSQLAKIRDLYSARDAVGPTYFFQSLENSVPLVGPLLAPDYLPGLATLVASQDPAPERRNRFLTYLLALYAQELSVAPAAACDCRHDEGDGLGKLIEAKRQLLHRLVPATRDRGRGFDYLAPPSPGNRAGMEIKTRIELGLVGATDETEEELDLVTVVEDEVEASFGRLLGEEATGQIDRSFIPLDPSLLPPAEPDQPSPLAGHTIGAALLQALQSVANYRLGVLPRDRMVSLICKAPGASDSWHVGRFASLEECFAELARILRAAARLLALSRRLYIVDHLLLRHARGGDQSGGFGYSFTVTAVLSASILGETNRQGVQGEVEDVVRRNAPAHVAVQYRFLGHRAMRHFIDLQRAWLAALRRDDPVERAEASRRLQHFLMHHDDRGEGGQP